MDFFDVVKGRRSIRKYTSKPIAENDAKQLLEAVNSAPSAGNLQSYEVFMVKSESDKRALAEATAVGTGASQDFISGASMILVFCASSARSDKYGDRGRSLYSLQDATIAAAYSQLAATALGLASVWIGRFDEGKVLKVLKNSEGLRPVAMIPIGYPAENPTPRPRRALDDLVHKV
jgi:nitroreductase